MDALADILSTVRVEGVCHGRILAAAPWGLKVDAGPEARFGYVSRGSCWLSVTGIAEPIALSSGDFFLLAPGMEFLLLDNMSSSARPLSEILMAQRGSSDGVIRFGGSGAVTTIIAGKFTFDGITAKPLTELLPLMILVPASQSRTLAIESTLELLAAEADATAPGAGVVIQRLADLVLIQALRAHLAGLNRGTTSRGQGLLPALADPHIGAVLRSMHEQIERPWTVASLALAAGMSRSAFAQRFKDVVGDGPVEYLTRWRMYRASHLLRESEKKLADVAQSVGYDSDVGFNKAFKRILGVAPGEYRKLAAGSATVSPAHAAGSPRESSLHASQFRAASVSDRYS
jgi:AraC-like DNA-binding protein